MRLTVYREPIATDQAKVAKMLCRDVAAIDGALWLERWTSSLLGRVWERRHLVTEELDTDVAVLAVGERVLESLANRGGREAKTALTAVAQIDRGPLGVLARELASSLVDAKTPEWVTQVGTTRIVKAYATPGSGPEEGLLLVPDQAAEPHMMAVFITDRGIAKHLSLMRLFDPADPPTPADEPGLASTLKFRPVDHILACRRLRRALERSDDAPSHLLGPGFAEHRALAIARITADEPPRAFGLQLERRSSYGGATGRSG